MIYDILTTSHWSWMTIVGVLAGFVGVVIAITVHEFAHARSAKSYGDDTADAMGRMTLNPAAHYDPIGSTLFLLFGWGWAKPVPIQPYRMRNPRFDAIRCALWGPFSNVLLAAAMGMVIRFSPVLPGWLAATLALMMYLNLWLAFFNLIPFPPLDGSRVITNLLPHDIAVRFERFAQQWGFLILLGLAFAFRGLLSTIIGVPVVLTTWLITGLAPGQFMRLMSLFW